MKIETSAETMRLASRDSDAPSPVLVGVTAEGRLDGVLFELSVRQTYRNTSDRLLEVVYTFPLPPQAVLLGFASELNGERQSGVVVARHEAERQYEEALVDGDAPVMLEALADGLHTANIGNLKPGDEIVLEVRHAQLLAFDAGRLRVAIPTTIAPRYGGPASAGLQPQQVPEVSLHAEYPLSLAITAGAGLANAAFDCPTHTFTRTQADAGAQRFELHRGAWLDRDVVIVVTPHEPRPSLLMNAHDPVSASAPHVVMAAFQPAAGAGRERIALKLLVDCSGSMGGDSIASARRALRGVVDSLAERDSVSLSRFGSTVEHPLASAACDGAHREKLLRAVERIDADLGGTEMEMALSSVFALASGSDLGCTDVLLITDGEIWNAQPMIEAARRSGHRVFALGVGASPAEAVLRQLAEATGGACEFCTPGEGLEEAARRALRRIRQPAWRDLAVDWGQSAEWQQLPAVAFPGDTVIVLAGFSRQPDSTQAVRLLATPAEGQRAALARTEASAPCPGDSLARIAASRRMALADDDAAREIAVGYQLMSKHTNCVLVHKRADADKAEGQAELHRVSSMLAAGWGATGSVAMAAGAVDLDACFDVGDRSMYRPMLSSSHVPFGDTLVGADLPQATTSDGPATLEDLRWASYTHLVLRSPVDELPAKCERLLLHADVRATLADLQKLGLSAAQAWIVIAGWICEHDGETRYPPLESALQPHLDAIDATKLEAARKIVARHLGRHSMDAWVPSRVERLKRALSRGRG